MSSTNFNDDLKIGATGEKIFELDYLNFLDIPFKDVSKNLAYREKGIDFIIGGGKSYEVKNNYKDDEILFVEEYANVNEELGEIKQGWWYTSKANWITFLSSKTHTMVILKRNLQTYNKYEEIKENYELNSNKTSGRNESTSTWQSAFRRIPLSEFDGLYSLYQKSTSTTSTPSSTPTVKTKEVVDDSVDVSQAPLISEKEKEELLNLF